QDALVLVHGIDEHHARNLRGIRCRIASNNASAKGVPDKNQWIMFAELVQRVVKLEIELSMRARLGTGIAPRIPGTVVRADSRKLFDSRLNKNPVEGKIAQTVFHYNRKISFARAVDMEAMAAEINELTWRWRTRHLGSRRWPATNHGYRQNSQN